MALHGEFCPDILMGDHVVALLPLLVLFFLAQRYITKGILLTGTKA